MKRHPPLATTITTGADAFVPLQHAAQALAIATPAGAADEAARALADDFDRLLAGPSRRHHRLDGADRTLQTSMPA